MSGFGAAALGGGMDLLNTGLNLYGQKRLQESQNKAEQTAADRAFEREALYNSPSEQMKRLREAGLNPNLVYGTGTTGMTGNTHASVARVAPQIDLPKNFVSGAIEKYLSLKGLELDNDIASRTAKNLDAQNSLILENTANARVDREIKTQALTSAVRENKLLGDTVSKNDPFYARLGGRIGLLSQKNSVAGVENTRYPVSEQKKYIKSDYLVDAKGKYAVK